MSSDTSARRVVAWASWDWGAAAFNTVVVTFVFPPYLTQKVGAGLPDGMSAAGLLGWAIGAAGLSIALLAPVVGVWADSPARRRGMLAVLSGIVVLITLGMTGVREDNRYLWLGLTLLSAGSVLCELATVPYNGMLHQLSTPESTGRISGFGWAAGYVGGVVVLLACYFGFMSGDGDARGLLRLTTEDGVNVRGTAILAAAWFGLFALPVLLAKPRSDLGAPSRSPSLFGAYRQLWADLTEQWRQDRNVVYYLLASALFRDGLAATFAMTSVVAANVYGLSAADILLFGVAANVVAAVGAICGGMADDRVGPKRVIVVSLACLVTFGLVMMCLSGAIAFWACGLAIAVFIGPSQSAARTLMLRMAPPGREALMFGLYTMTGRAVSFLAPWMFSTFVLLFHADRAGIAGLVLVIGSGLAALLFVRAPQPHTRQPEKVSDAS